MTRNQSCRTLADRLLGSALAAAIMLGAWLPTVNVPADTQFAAAPVTVELA